MCNKLPIIQSNLPLGLIRSPHGLQMLGFIGGFDLALTEKFIGKEFLQ